MKSLWKGGGAYGLANVLTSGAQFIAIIIFAGALRAEDFGQLSIFSVLWIVLSMVIGLGLSAAAQRAYFEIDLDAFKSLVSTMLKAVLAFAAALGLVVACLPDNVIVYSGLPRHWVFHALATASAQVVVQMVLTVLQTQERIATYLKVVMLQVSIHLAFSTTFLLTQQHDWPLAILAQSAAPLFTGVVAAVTLYRTGYIVKHASVKALTVALHYSLPLVPHQVAGWVISMLDRFIIVTYMGVGQAGIYSLAFQIAQATNIVSNSFNQALVPVMFRMLSESSPDATKLRRLNGGYALGLLAFSVSFVGAFLVIAPWLLRTDYLPALEYTPWLILAFLMLAFSRISSNFLMFHGHTIVLAASTMVAAGSSIALNLILVPWFGALGACWASVGSFSLLLCITSWRALKCRKAS